MTQPRSAARIIGVAMVSLIVGATIVVVWRKSQISARRAIATSSSAPSVPASVVMLEPATDVSLAELSPAAPVLTTTTTIATTTTTPTPVATTTTIAPIATTKITPTATAQTPITTTPRTIQITTTVHGTHITDADAAREIARLRSKLDACYQAPECNQTASPWCINSRDEKTLDWKLIIGLDGRVRTHQHLGGGIQTGNCVGHTFDDVHFAPYATDTSNIAYDAVTITIVIQ